MYTPVRHNNPRVLPFLRTIIALVVLIPMTLIVLHQKHNLVNGIPWVGAGTDRSPYLIRNYDDLCTLRDLVNEGKNFSGCYFMQTNDIDMETDDPWIPIGVMPSNHYFFGVYDGGGHSISNLYITQETSQGSSGLFGMLGGTVKNLGIESGRIEGNCVGSFASHACASTAQIINCYNKAELVGTIRAGGICDNFPGSVINCLNIGPVSAPQSSGIVSYDAARVFLVYSVLPATADNFTGDIAESHQISPDENIAETLNAGIDLLEKNGGVSERVLLKWRSEV